MEGWTGLLCGMRWWCGKLCEIYATVANSEHSFCCGSCCWCSCLCCCLCRCLRCCCLWQCANQLFSAAKRNPCAAYLHDDNETNTANTPTNSEGERVQRQWERHDRQTQIERERETNRASPRELARLNFKCIAWKIDIDNEGSDGGRSRDRGSGSTIAMSATAWREFYFVFVLRIFFACFFCKWICVCCTAGRLYPSVCVCLWVCVVAFGFALAAAAAAIS